MVIEEIKFNRSDETPCKIISANLTFGTLINDGLNEKIIVVVNSQLARSIHANIEALINANEE